MADMADVADMAAAEQGPLRLVAQVILSLYP